MLQIKRTSPGQSQDTARGTDNNVRTVFLDCIFVLLDANTAEEYANLYAGHVFTKSLVLFADLESQLSGVAHDQDWHLAVDNLELL